jgi:NAD(P)-dependent dehydrogenase (short-subunit alcohol dehydrogenase family)
MLDLCRASSSNEQPRVPKEKWMKDLVMSLLEGKNAVVTGGGRGIGKAAALLFAKNGANVAIVSRSQAELDATVIDIESHYVRGLAIVADLGTEQGPPSVASSFFDHFDRCDILVNNAGMSHYTTVAEWPVEDVKRLFDLNILGTYLMCKEFAHRMVEQGAGKIIMVSSVMGNTVFAPKHVAYCASKAAVAAMGRSLQAELGRAVQVNVILPGLIKTKLVLDMAPAGYPVNDPMEPEAIAPAFLFLASDLSNRATGRLIDLSDVLQVMERVRTETSMLGSPGPDKLKDLVKTMKLTPDLRATFKENKDLIDFWLDIDASGDIGCPGRE